jgi:hypothetical protein
MRPFSHDVVISGVACRRSGHGEIQYNGTSPNLHLPRLTREDDPAGHIMRFVLQSIHRSKLEHANDTQLGCALLFPARLLQAGPLIGKPQL